MSPLTAGGLDPCLRLSDLAARVLDDALRTGAPDPLTRYSGASLRSRFRGRLALRNGLAHIRTPAATTAAFTLLRTPPGRAAAARILFGDRSFPGRPVPSRARSAADPAAAASRRPHARPCRPVHAGPMASDQPTVVIYPPSGDGGRRVRAGPHFLGMAYTLLDVVEFLRLHGMDDADGDWLRRSPSVEWRGGGPETWTAARGLHD